MNTTLIATLAGLGVAAFVANDVGGVEATGVLSGYLFGASLGLLGVSLQRHVISTRPEHALNAQLIAFLFKLAGALVGTLCLRYIGPVGEVADWRTFLLAYASAVLVTLLFGALDSSRFLKRRSAH